MNAIATNIRRGGLILAGLLFLLPAGAPAQVYISEILADPPNELAGDANGDGARDTYADEFVELFNAGADVLSLAGWRLSDDDTTPAHSFVFPPGAYLDPGGYLVLFGGGAPTGFSVPVFTDDGRIGDGLSNSGDTVFLIDAHGDTADVVHGHDWPADRAAVRNADGAFAAHPDPEAFSPGRASLSIAPPPANPPDPPPSPAPPAHLPPVQLLVTEILADPPGDVNGDGQIDRDEDEFIELFNPGPDLDLSGWRLSDDDTTPEHQFHFPAGTLLQSGQYLVLFGGGNPRPLPGLVFADDGALGDGLANSGDRILLIGGAAADTLLDFTYTSKPDLNQSLACGEDAPCAPHGQLPGRTPFSPGAPRSLYTGFSIDPLTLMTDQSDALVLRGQFPGGNERIDPARVLWHVEDSRLLRVGKDGVARGLKPGTTTVDAWIPQLLLASGSVQVQAPPPPPPPPNQPPLFVSQPDTLAYVGSHYHCTLLAEDPEHSTLLYTPTRLPVWLQWEPATRTLSGQAPLQPGSDEIAVEVDDGQGGLASQRYTLHLVPLPEIRFSEALSDPPPGLAGDANGDGQRHSQTDEFVELLNPASTPVELSGWVLAEEKSGQLFRFPAGILLPAEARAVVFGDDAPEELFFFSAGGRLGQGLNNRQGALYLIDPAGPDTLARASYHLDRDPDQSICWTADREAPMLHSQWPGRDLFSPGKARPQLQTLNLEPPRLLLTTGESAQLKVVGRYSDGLQQELHLAGQWGSSSPAVAPLKGQGIVAAKDTGRTRIWVQLDTFAASCQVTVLYPLPKRVEFFPSWERFAAPVGLPLSFAVRSLAGESLDCAWSVNGRLQQTRAQRLVYRAPTLHPDTVEVEVRVRQETYTHRWLLQPGNPQPRQADTLIAAGPLRPRNHPNPFNSSTHIRFQLPDSAQPPILRLYDLAGQQVRQLAVSAEQADWYRAIWDGLDDQGRPAASGIYLYTIESGSQRQLGKLLLLR